MFKRKTNFIILVTLLSVFGFSSCAKGTPANSEYMPPEIILPEYTIFKDKSYEDAGTEKIIWEILVSPDITADSLEILLGELYKKAYAKSSGKNDRPLVIDIKTFTSEEYATSGMGQWIGWVSKRGFDSDPNYSYNDRQLQAISKSSATKFGLSQEERIRIWQDIVRAEDRAEEEAFIEFPDMTPFEEFDELEIELISIYKSELAENEGLTLEQLNEIANEGFRNDWPFPEK